MLSLALRYQRQVVERWVHAQEVARLAGEREPPLAILLRLPVVAPAEGNSAQEGQGERGALFVADRLGQLVAVLQKPRRVLGVASPQRGHTPHHEGIYRDRYQLPL